MNPLLRTALDAAEAAAWVQRRDAARVATGGAKGVVEKGRADYVSQTDLDAQEAALVVIRKRYPNHEVLAEEDAESVEARLRRWDGRPLWIVDPLDGTTNFLHSIPQFAISIALQRSDAIVAALVYNPVTDELFTAERGKGAFLNDTRLRVAARQRLADAVIACPIPHRGRGDVALGNRELAAVQPHVAGLRRFGAAALDFAWVAAGRTDGYWERNLSPWDIAAGLLLVREAGGFVTDLDGGDAMLSKGHVVAGNEAMHRELLAVLRPAAKD